MVCNHLSVPVVAVVNQMNKQCGRIWLNIKVGPKIKTQVNRVLRSVSVLLYCERSLNAGIGDVCAFQGKKERIVRSTKFTVQVTISLSIKVSTSSGKKKVSNCWKAEAS